MKTLLAATAFILISPLLLVGLCLAVFATLLDVLRIKDINSWKEL